jgi:hypothetical protein
MREQPSVSDVHATDMAGIEENERDARMKEI